MAKVLHVVRALGTGGAERVVYDYAISHDRSRYEPEVCCVLSGGELARDLERRGVPVHVLSRRSKADLRATFSLARIISRGGFDVVHNHNLTGVLVGVPAAVIGRAGAVVRTEHNVVAERWPLRGALCRLAALREDAQIAVSGAVRDSHVAARTAAPSRFVTIWNGIDDSRLGVEDPRPQVRRELGIEDGVIVCLTVGSLTPQKNHRVLLEAASRLAADLPAARFLIVGDGPLRADLEARARELGVGGSVEFVGESFDVPRFLKAANVFVLSSLWEGLPITLIEAMSAGLPCVVTSVGGIPEIIADGENGLLVEPNDPDALAQAIRRVASDSSLATRMIGHARSTYELCLSAGAMVRQTEALYDLALAGRADLAQTGRIKILFLIGQLTYGGAERQLFELVSRLPRDVFDPVVCSLRDVGPIRREIEEAGVRVVTLGKRAGVLSRTSRNLLELIRVERPAVLHTYLFSANWRGVIVGRYAKVPVIISSVRNVDIHSNWLFVMLERLLSGLADRVIANAEAVKEFVSRSHGVDPRKIRVIRNGVSIERIARGAAGARPSRRSEGGRADGKTVAMIASLTAKKDHDTFLAAASRVREHFPRTRFVAVGDGPLRARLASRAEALGMRGEEIFVGETPDTASFLATVDVSVLTSLKEGCSNAILESMAAGKPVVVTGVGGNPELVEDGVTGYVVPAGDSEAVARRVIDLLTDEDLRTTMGEAGRKKAVEGFTVERMVEETVGFYTQLLDERLPGLLRWIEASAGRIGPRDRSPREVADPGGKVE